MSQVKPDHLPQYYHDAGMIYAWCNDRGYIALIPTALNPYLEEHAQCLAFAVATGNLSIQKREDMALAALQRAMEGYFAWKVTTESSNIITVDFKNRRRA